MATGAMGIERNQLKIYYFLEIVFDAGGYIDSVQLQIADVLSLYFIFVDDIIISDIKVESYFGQ